MSDLGSVVHVLVLGTVYAFAPVPLIYAGYLLFFKTAPGLAERIDDLSAQPDPIPSNLAWADTALREFGFEPIGETAFRWPGLGPTRPPSTTRIWKYRGPDPGVSGGVHDKLAAVSFWSVWPGRGSITTAYPFGRPRSYGSLRLQGTNVSAVAAHRMHLASVREASATAGPPADLSTMAAVMAADAFEMETMRRNNEATLAAARRCAVAGSVLILLVLVVGNLLT